MCFYESVFPRASAPSIQDSSAIRFKRKIVYFASWVTWLLASLGEERQSGAIRYVITPYFATIIIVTMP